MSKRLLTEQENANKVSLMLTQKAEIMIFNNRVISVWIGCYGFGFVDIRWIA